MDRRDIKRLLDDSIELLEKCQPGLFECPNLITLKTT